MRMFSLVEDFSELREVAQTHPEGRSSVSLHEGGGLRSATNSYVIACRAVNES